MDVRSIGLHKPIREVELGQCVLFAFEGRAEIGIIVGFSDGARGVLHLGARRDGAEIPTVYDLNHFSNEVAIHIAEARIVPVLAPEHVDFGRAAGRTVSTALYITGDAVFVMAHVNHSAVAVNLFKGLISHLDTWGAIHTRAWHIEVPDAQGSFEPFHEFRCELPTGA